MKTYLLYHENSEICESALRYLPKDHHLNMDVVCVDHINHSLPNHLKGVMQSKRNTKETKSPTVMYFDPSTQSHIRYDGIKALTFLHQYKTTSQANQLRYKTNQMMESTNSVVQEAKHLEKVLEIDNNNKATEFEKKSSLLDSFKSIHQIQLQKLYNKIHNMNPKQAEM
jgi:hypothetical protein